MQFKFFHSSFAMIIFTIPILVLGIDPATSGRILNEFKKQERAILFENLPFDESGANQIYEKEYILSGIEGLKNRVKEMAKQYEERKVQIVLQRETLEDTIASLDYLIAGTSADIKKIEKSIEDKSLAIQEYKDLAHDLSDRIKKNRSIILAYIANIYSEGNIIYNTSNEVDIIQGLILSSSSTDEVGRDIFYKSLISNLGQQFIDDYRSLVKEYYLIQTRIKDEIASLDTENESLSKKKSTLIGQRTYREELLKTTQGKQELYEQYIESQRLLQEKLEDSWLEAHESYTESIDSLLLKNGCSKKKKSENEINSCAKILNFYKNERVLKNMKTRTGTTNVLRWPATPLKGISAFFKDPSYFRAIGSQHDAIDIPLPQGTDIKAALGGYIYYILPPVSGGYSYLAIKHPDGYVTVYGHLSEVLVSEYQFVEEGEIIARSGGEPGTPGAGPMTSGPHLHFEVFHDREPLDPLRVLDLSMLDYENLPSRYQDKFITDISEKFGTGTQIDKYQKKFVIKGSNETERQKFLLKTYATPDFQNWDMWISAALDAEIDPSFLMCVGLAETTLGNYVKTLNNVGNVGNTDSGDVMSFSTPRQGIEAMAKTFNNRYLGQYKYISELSRWGNEDGTIYASSNANWHNNIIRCLSSIQGRFVEDRYEFRRISAE